MTTGSKNSVVAIAMLVFGLTKRPKTGAAPRPTQSVLARLIKKITISCSELSQLAFSPRLDTEHHWADLSVADPTQFTKVHEFEDA